MTLTLSSSAFRSGGKIPSRYSKDEANLSPPIEWQGGPRKARSYALIVEDPDSPKGMFRHWAVYDIPAKEHGLSEGAGSRKNDASVKMAVNDFGNRRYDGPRPPPGHGLHHYHFRLAALDVSALSIPSDANAMEVWNSARAHAIAEAELVGTFEQ